MIMDINTELKSHPIKLRDLLVLEGTSKWTANCISNL